MFAAGNKKSMDTNAQQINNNGQALATSWHYETLPRRTQKALMFLSGEKWLKESGWYLAGGTALALSTGHRKSLDLDFLRKIKISTRRSCWENF